METVSALLALCAGNSPVTRSLDVSFDLHLNKHLSNQPWGWWFETPSRSLWRHSDENIDMYQCTLSRISVSAIYEAEPIGVNKCAYWCKSIEIHTVEPLYNTIVFHQNTHKRHPIAILNICDNEPCYKEVLLYHYLTLLDKTILSIPFDNEISRFMYLCGK